jgi:hypothetical protein
MACEGFDNKINVAKTFDNIAAFTVEQEEY